MKTRQQLHVLVIGMLMGAAEVVPGVSGGTIAFISGYYEKLLHSIRQCTPYLLVRLRNDGFVTLWRELDVNFMLLLFGGMGVSILLFASGVSYLLVNEPILIWSFFFGLVLASSAIVFLEIEQYNLRVVVSFIMGLVVGLVVTNVIPLNLSPTPLALFFGGAVAVCAWILPGLSGSFILLILGLYAFVLDAVKSFEWMTLATVAAGCLVGLVSFAQGLSWLFARYRSETLAVLTGFMVGSLTRIWPWKMTTSYQIKQDGSQIPLVQQPVYPSDYMLTTGDDAQIMVAVVSVIAGIVIVVLLNWFAGRKDESPVSE